MPSGGKRALSSRFLTLGIGRLVDLCCRSTTTGLGRRFISKFLRRVAGRPTRIFKTSCRTTNADF
jgi:hypothetical protein